MYSVRYICDHPVYTICTLYKINDKGLAVIQQKYDRTTKHTWWGELDPWLADAIYLTKGFREYFDRVAREATDGIFPTVTVRQIMWALRMKPLPKEKWETVFDRSRI